MKYIIALLLGLIVGACLFVAGLMYNPFSGGRSLSPLSVTNAQTVSLSYSAVAADSIVYTNNGESATTPYPENVIELWEAPIRKSWALATVLHDARDQPVGYGVKFASLSEETRLLAGSALVNSVWYIYLPGRGSLFIEQKENYWDYFREVMLPAYLSSADTWKGTWLGNMTAGPGALGTAKVSGGGGSFAGLETPGVESMSVKLWRGEGGPIAADGRLIIELPMEQPASDEPVAELD
jgi:hypothetical protein